MKKLLVYSYQELIRETSVGKISTAYFSSEGSFRNTSGAIHCGWIGKPHQYVKEKIIQGKALNQSC